MTTCAPDLNSRRRKFWATQPNACGIGEGCGPCGKPGLTLTEGPCGDPDLPCGSPLFESECPEPPCSKPRTIVTENWVIGLALNMLLTNARHEDHECGYRPSGINGHWSESYNAEGPSIGSSLRYIPTTTSIREAVSLIKAQAQATMQKLVNYGVAHSVSVEASYAGGRVVELVIEIVGQSGDVSRVGLSGSRLENGWAWL